MTVVRCKVCNDTIIRSQVDRMFGDGMSDDAISRALNTAGVSIPASLIMRHRLKHWTADTEPVNEPVDDMVISVASVEPEPEPVADDDITKSRLVREGLLQRILESQLAITATALEKFQRGEGRYPNDMVRATATTWGLFEKTTLHTMAANRTKEALFEQEVVRLERVAYETALVSDSVDPPESMLMSVNDFGDVESYRFGGYGMSGSEFNERIRTAWDNGFRAKGE